MRINRSQIVAAALVALLAVAALGIFAVGPWNNAAAQEQPAAAAPSLPRTITVLGEGTVATQPDVAQIQVGVEVKGDNAQEASAEAATDEVIYHVGNSVSVTVRDLDTVGDVLDAAIAAGANSIYGVNFSVDDPDEVMAEARSLAVEDALARAEELAGLHSVALGEVVSISEMVNGMAVPMYDSVNASMGLGSAAGPISPGELEMTARLQVVYAIAGPAGD